jgi:L-2-hydroxyglutarate oxidase
MTRDHFDYVVIGGGLIGLATALALLSRSKASVLVVEAERLLAQHQSGRNSGVIHSGLYYAPGSLKARLCSESRSLLFRFCEANAVRYEQCGKIVIATRQRDIPKLIALEERGKANGLEGLQHLDPTQIREYEPRADGIAALHVPATGIVDFSQVAGAMAERIKELGGSIQVGARLRTCVRQSTSTFVSTTEKEFSAGYLINCGGLQADRIARICGLKPNLRIIPFRGEYYELKPSRRHLVRNLIYPVPDPELPFLGVHFTRTIHGSIDTGPNAVLAFKREGYRWSSFSTRDLLDIISFPGFWRLATSYWSTGIGEYYRSIWKTAMVRDLQRLVPEVQAEDLTRSRSGVRAQAVDSSGKLVDDFRIVEAPQMLHLLNAPSPGATSSLRIGETLAERALKGDNSV